MTTTPTLHLSDPARRFDPDSMFLSRGRQSIVVHVTHDPSSTTVDMWVYEPDEQPRSLGVGECSCP